MRHWPLLLANQIAAAFSRW
jgi:hypothetical protein